MKYVTNSSAVHQLISSWGATLSIILYIWQTSTNRQLSYCLLRHNLLCYESSFLRSNRNWIQNSFLHESYSTSSHNTPSYVLNLSTARLSSREKLKFHLHTWLPGRMTRWTGIHMSKQCSEVGHAVWPFFADLPLRLASLQIEIPGLQTWQHF